MSKEVDSILGSVAAKQSEAEAVREEAERGLEDLRHNIITGEQTTGDRLEDGLIALYGTDLLDDRFMAKATANFQSVDELLKGNSGQPVLMIHRYKELRPGCYGFGQRPQYNTISLLHYGILNGDAIEFDFYTDEDAPFSTTAKLPTQKHALQIENQEPVLSREGGILIAGRYSTSKHAPMPRPVPDLGREGGQKEPILPYVAQPHPVIEVWIGYENIANGISHMPFGYSGYLSIREMAVELDLPIPEPPEELRQHYEGMIEKMRQKLADDLSEIRVKRDKIKEHLGGLDDEEANIIKTAKRKGINLDQSSS